MHKIFFVSGSVALAFFVEFLVANLFSIRLVPELNLMLVVFFNLAFGIRYSIFTAVLAGLLRESFSGQLFGIYLLSFVVCAYLTTVLRPYIYQPGSVPARIVMMTAIILINFSIHLCLSFKWGPVDMPAAFRFVLFPQLVSTLIAAAFLFPYMRKCVLKYFV